MKCPTSWRIAFPLFILAVLVLPATPEERAKEKGSIAANTAAALKSPEVAIEARGERQLRQLRYSGWRKLCFRPSEAGTVCRTTIAGVTETGQEMLRVDLIEGSIGQGGRLQIFVPPMLFLEAGVRVSIGQGEAVRVPFAWCFSNTCVAARAVDATFIGRMKAGKEMTLKVVDARLSTVLTSLPLDRFASINQGPPSLTFGESLEGAPAPNK